MAHRRCWMFMLTGAVALAPWLGCGSDDSPAPASAGAGGAAGSDAASEAGGAAGTLITGGSAGSSDAANDAPDDGSGACVIKNLDFGQTCNDCAKKHCCTSFSACDSDPSCVSLATCVAACPVDDAGVIESSCIQDCASKQDVISPAYNSMTLCLGNTDPDAGETCGAPCPF
ncbi:MAG: hypothetical protein HY898_05595 [Deltaproteobacteria bacterium]|nr:hypothetical protein [Deltaproteobacteria bacterium]